MAIRTSDSRWDLSVNNRNGQLVLAVEVKRRTDTSLEWVMDFRRNMLSHGILPKAPYFLMAFLDKFYLWTDADIQTDRCEPNYIIDAKPILEPYFKRAGIIGDQISPQSLELIIESWLGEIIHAENLPNHLNASQHWLIESGLYNALTGGKLEYEAAA